MKKYKVIYADPPWRYERKNVSGAAEKHYSTMSLDDIKSLPVDNLADEDCVLFLWITFPMLCEAWGVIESWGFRYKSVAFVWIKQNRKAPTFFWGMGNWTRSNAELCLIATKGNPKRQSKSIHQIIVSPIEEHSKKPDEARKRIVKLMGDVPRIELFAREHTPGWDVWGNEVPDSIIFPCTGKEA